jgi:hypothetical protein
MHSLRQHFEAIGLGNHGGSVLHGFFGLGEAPETLSLRQQMERVRRDNVMHLNVIRVAFDTVFPRAPLERKVDMAVHRSRQIFDQAGIGVARVSHYMIEDAFAGLYPDIGSDGEADDLCDAYSVDNDGIDVFMVLTYAGNRVGSSHSPGSCDKDGKDSGVVIEVTQGSRNLTAKAFSHELAHYLGYDDHSSDENNLMSSSENGLELTSGQIDDIDDHCMLTRTFLAGT